MSVAVAVRRIVNVFMVLMMLVFVIMFMVTFMSVVVFLFASMFVFAFVRHIRTFLTVAYCLLPTAYLLLRHSFQGLPLLVGHFHN